jgi:hypothetical protein
VRAMVLAVEKPRLPEITVEVTMTSEEWAYILRLAARGSAGRRAGRWARLRRCSTATSAPRS